MRFNLEDGTPMLTVAELDNDWAACDGCMGATANTEHPPGLVPVGNCHALPGNCSADRNPTGHAVIYIREADLVAYLEAARTLGEPA